MLAFSTSKKSCFVVGDLVCFTYSVLERRGTELSYLISHRAFKEGMGRGDKFLKKLPCCVGGVGSVDVSSVSPSLWEDGSGQVWQVFISNMRECFFSSHLPLLQTKI